MYNGVSERFRVKAGVVSITVPPSKAHFAFTTVLERRAHVPNDVFGVGVGNGRREDVPAVLQRREGECAEFAGDHGVVGAKCRDQQPILLIAILIVLELKVKVASTPLEF